MWLRPNSPNPSGNHAEGHSYEREVFETKGLTKPHRRLRRTLTERPWRGAFRPLHNSSKIVWEVCRCGGVCYEQRHPQESPKFPVSNICLTVWYHAMNLNNTLRICGLGCESVFPTFLQTRLRACSAHLLSSLAWNTLSEWYLMKLVGTCRLLFNMKDWRHIYTPKLGDPPFPSWGKFY